jgi:hypothetical protein
MNSELSLEDRLLAPGGFSLVRTLCGGGTLSQVQPARIETTTRRRGSDCVAFGFHELSRDTARRRARYYTCANFPTCDSR